MRQLTIGQHTIADDSPSFTVAEVGNNHGGNVDLCKAMFRAAAEAGCSAVKLQKRSNRTLYTTAMFNAPYTGDNSFGATYGEHREAQEFGWDEYLDLKDYSRKLGIVFFATAFDIPSADFLAQVGVPAFKIASGDLKSIPLIRHVAQFGQPVIVSTGGGTLEDIERAHAALGDCPHAFLQCTAEYPLVRYEELNLKAIEVLRERFPDTVIGFSSHEDGIDAAVPAYMLGARIHEQHFTTSHTLKGSDNPWSLEPEGMTRLVRSLTRAHASLGDGVKRRYEAEEKPLMRMEKAIYPREYYPIGHTLRPGDLELRSPGAGLAPYKLDKLIGRRLREPLDGGKAIDSSGIVE